jgi:nitroreductase
MDAARPSTVEPRDVYDAAFPRNASAGEQLRFMLNWAVLAPSVLNTQPWRFEIEGEAVQLYADRRRQLRRTDPEGRELAISCGAALFNLRMAARHYGYAVDARVMPDTADPDLLAVLRLKKPWPPGADERALFRAIERRRTERRAFAPEAVAPAALRALKADARKEGARLHAFTEAAEKTALAERIAEAIRALGADPERRAEFAAWLRNPHDPRPDGVPDTEQAILDLRAGQRALVSTVAAATRDLAAGAPVLLALTTERDDAAAWVAAGQALERVLLRATTLDLAASYLNPVVQVEAHRAWLAERVGGGFPQVVLRLGHPFPRGGTPRRRVSDVAS